MLARVAIVGLALAVLAGWIVYSYLPYGIGRLLDVRPGTFGTRIERGQRITMSDGIALVADVYHPLGAGPTTPTILVRIPYTKSLTTMLFGSVIGRFWAEHGYTAVIQGTRGRYESEGVYSPLVGERQDGLDTLRWLKAQPWFDGRLGMWGGSYFGYTQWVLADQTNPGPTALLLQLCSTDFYRMFHPGGAFALESALSWAVLSRGSKDLPQWPTRTELAAAYDALPLDHADDRVAEDIGFFNDWVTHAERDQFWLSVDGQDRAKRLEAPALLMAGWFDPFLPTQLADYAQIRREARPEVARAARLIIGPWAHANSVTFPDGQTPRNYRLESLAPSIPWFDRHLRPHGAVDRELPPVRLYVMGARTWRDEQEWPLARARVASYYLHSEGRANSATGDGSLTLVPPSVEEPADTYSYDPGNPVPTAGGAIIGPSAGIRRQNEMEARPDVLVYTTTPLTEDLEVTGPITVVLHVMTTAPQTDFTGKLVDVHPDGSAYNVSDGILRRAYVAGAVPTEIQIELWPTSMVFLKGHRLRLEVSSSNYPRFDRNPNTSGQIATETSLAVARQSIHHSVTTPSRLILPVIPAR